MTPESPWPALTLSAALLLWPSGGALLAGRVRALRPDGARATAIQAAASRVPPVHRHRLLAAAAGVAAGLLIGGVPGLAVAVVVALLVGRSLGNGGSEDERILRAALLRDLPGACDLLAVCLAAGLPVGGALAAVGESLPGPLGPRLLAVAGLYRLGAEPGRAWAEVPTELAPLARALVRVGESGASVGPALATLAADTRSSVRAAVEAEVRRAGVWVLAPLGLCFLPGFVCLGVAPLVLGIAADVLG